MEISRIPTRALMSTHLFPNSRPCCELQLLIRQRKEFAIRALEKNHTSKKHKKLAVPSSNYMVRMDDTSMFSCLIRRPLSEILRDLNKRVPEKIIKPDENNRFFIPWYHANRMLSFYAPGWCGEIRDVTFSENGSVTVVYRITIRGSDGEAHRESTGTVSLDNSQFKDPVAAAEEIAFCRACARFGLGLYLYHGEEIP